MNYSKSFSSRASAAKNQSPICTEVVLNQRNHHIFIAAIFAASTAAIPCFLTFNIFLLQLLLKIFFF